MIGGMVLNIGYRVGGMENQGMLIIGYQGLGIGVVRECLAGVNMWLVGVVR